MKVVYITGCLGFIGSYITRLCLNKGWYVKGVDKMTYAANKELLEEFKKSDKDLRTLTYRIILEKFNGKYDDLNHHQKSILKE